MCLKVGCSISLTTTPRVCMFSAVLLSYGVPELSYFVAHEFFDALPIHQFQVSLECVHLDWSVVLRYVTVPSLDT